MYHQEDGRSGAVWGVVVFKSNQSPRLLKKSFMPAASVCIFSLFALSTTRSRRSFDLNPARNLILHRQPYLCT